MSDVFSTKKRYITIASTTRLPICYLYPGSGWQCCSCSGRRCNEALCSRCRPPDWLERPAGRVFPSLCVSGMQPPCWPQRPPLLLHWTSAGTTQPGPSSGKYMNKNDSWWSMNLINIYYMFRTFSSPALKKYVVHMSSFWGQVLHAIFYCLKFIWWRHHIQ